MSDDQHAETCLHCALKGALAACTEARGAPLDAREVMTALGALFGGILAHSAQTLARMNVPEADAIAMLDTLWNAFNKGRDAGALGQHEAGEAETSQAVH